MVSLEIRLSPIHIFVHLIEFIDLASTCRSSWQLGWYPLWVLFSRLVQLIRIAWLDTGWLFGGRLRRWRRYYWLISRRLYIFCHGWIGCLHWFDVAFDFRSTICVARWSCEMRRCLVAISLYTILADTIVYANLHRITIRLDTGSWLRGLSWRVIGTKCLYLVVVMRIHLFTKFVVSNIVLICGIWMIWTICQANICSVDRGICCSCVLMSLFF